MRTGFVRIGPISASPEQMLEVERKIVGALKRRRGWLCLLPTLGPALLFVILFDLGQIDWDSLIAVGRMSGPWLPIISLFSLVSLGPRKLKALEYTFVFCEDHFEMQSCVNGHHRARGKLAWSYVEGIDDDHDDVVVRFKPTGVFRLPKVRFETPSDVSWLLARAQRH